MYNEYYILIYLTVFCLIFLNVSDHVDYKKNSIDLNSKILGIIVYTISSE